MKYIFASLAIISLVTGLITMFDVGFIPYTVKTFFSFVFSGILSFSIFAYIDCKEEVAYTQHSKRIRKQQMNGLLISAIITGIILLLIFFTL
jgi:hypothetical protein